MYKPTNAPKSNADLASSMGGRATLILLSAGLVLALLILSAPAIAQDTEAPIIEPIPTWFFECREEVPPPDTGLVRAYDAVSGTDVYIELVAEEHLLDWGCEITIFRTYSATDPSGNTAEVVHVIEIQDTTYPFAEAPADIEVKCGKDVPDPDPGLVRAQDLCSQDWDIQVIWAGDSQIGTGCGSTIEREYVVVDECGNQISVFQTITMKGGNGGGKGGGNGGGKKK